MYELDNIPATIKYKQMWKHLLSNFIILTKENHIYFKEKFSRKVYVFLSLLSFKFKGFLDFYYYRNYVFKKNKFKNYEFGTLYYLNIIKHIKPLGITQRK
jgi:hypothetical protein